MHFIEWVGANVLAVGYRYTQDDEDENAMFYMMTLSQNTQTFQELPLGLQDADTLNMYHHCQISTWNCIVVGGSNFQELEVVGNDKLDDRGPAQSSHWKIWTFADDS